MKRLYLLLFIGIAAIALIAVCMLTFDPKTETWASLVAGVCIGLIIVKLPVIVAYLKKLFRPAK